MESPVDRPVFLATHSNGREKWWLVGGAIISNVHPAGDCQDTRHCIVHNPSRHHMATWPMVTSNSLVLGTNQARMFIWRTCPHGQNHPDPDENTHRKGPGGNHLEKCDGCCSAPIDLEAVADIRVQLREALVKLRPSEEVNPE